MLSYIKAYRKLRGGKWYKCAKFTNAFGVIFYYSKSKPKDPRDWVVRKYKY
jgi:hypothetical protein